MDTESIVIMAIIALGPVSLFIIILAAVKNGVEKASIELKEDFIDEFNIRKVKENEGHNEN
ncbi:hypothetical protein HMPREF1982_03332 [Clostridiales bacterium oral taxon 876 str. F0540]|nr:hypothetical protein HMPREF1982_03332 [Clostridiales bacterium oral taxon 876 str. F0540]